MMNENSGDQLDKVGEEEMQLVQLLRLASRFGIPPHALLSSIGQQNWSAKYLHCQQGGGIKTLFFSREIFGNGASIKFILREECNITNQCHERSIMIELDPHIKSAASLLNSNIHKHGHDNLNVNSLYNLSGNSLPALPSHKIFNSTPKIKLENTEKSPIVTRVTRPKKNGNDHNNLNKNTISHSDNSPPALLSLKTCNATPKIKVENTEKSQIVTRITRQKKNANNRNNLNINTNSHSDNSPPALLSHKICNATPKIKLANTEKSPIVTRVTRPKKNGNDHNNLNKNTISHSDNSPPALLSHKICNATPKIKLANTEKSPIVTRVTRPKKNGNDHNNLNKNTISHSDNSPPALLSLKTCNATPKIKVENTEKSQIVTRITRQKKNGNDQIFQCTYCSFVAKSSKGLYIHTGKSHNSGGYVCCDCSFRTSQIIQFHRHQVNVHNYERPYGCKYCNYRATTKFDLRSHIGRLHPGKTITFCYQQIKWIKKTSRSHHQATSNPGKYRCMDCNFSTNNPVYLERHKVQVHNYPRLHACAHCKYSAITKPDLITHNVTVHCDPKKRIRHNESKANASQKCDSLICEACELHFKSRRSLHYHSNKKHGIMGFQCSECNFSANKIALLNRHLCNVHNYPRTYTCHHCTYSAITKYDLKMHIISKHMKYS